MTKRSDFLRELSLRIRAEQSLAQANQLLGIDETDYGPIDPEEIKKRVEARIEEQNNVMYPQRLREGRVTPQWRDYIRRRL